MAAPPRNLVPFHLAMPVSLFKDIADDATKEFLRIFHQTFDDMTKKFSNAINSLMTNRYGDTFYGAMNFGSGGTFTVPVVAVDPVAPPNGMIWLNSTTNIFKIRINGVTRSVTVT